MTKTSARRLRVGVAMLGLSVLAALFVVGLCAVNATWQGAIYRCAVSGPSSPDAAVDERGPVDASFSPWSLGRLCEWNRADGDGTVTADSGTPGCVLVLGLVPAAGLAVIGSALGRGVRGTTIHS